LPSIDARAMKQPLLDVSYRNESNKLCCTLFWSLDAEIGYINFLKKYLSSVYKDDPAIDFLNL